MNLRRLNLASINRPYLGYNELQGQAEYIFGGI